MEIQQYFSNRQHPFLIRDDESINDLLFCGKCGCPIEAQQTFYVCEVCEYFVHESCAKWPHRIISDCFHPLHPLTFTRPQNFYCDCCFRYFENAPSFSCDQCFLHLDVDCALMLNSVTPYPEDQHCIQHSSHPHSLVPIDRDIKKDFEIECFACKFKSSTPLGGEVYYGCTRCEYFLHKECLDKLPQETPHPVNPEHGLLSLRVTRWPQKCSLCEKEDYGKPALRYTCFQCQFQFCMECGSAFEKSVKMKYEDHEHLLYFVEKIHADTLECNAQNAYCKLQVLSYSPELQSTYSPVFRCLDCRFKIHLLCGPLPNIIKHKWHLDPLILFDSLVEDDSGEYYCDVCESERNEQIRVYYCKPCKFVAHVLCVVSEIVDVLNGDLKDVLIQTLGESSTQDQVVSQSARKDMSAVTLEDVICEGTEAEAELWRNYFESDDMLSLDDRQPAVCLKDLLYKITKKEQRVLSFFCEWDETSSKDDGQPEDSHSITQFDDKDVNRILKLSRFTSKEYGELVTEMNNVFGRSKLKLTSSELALKIIGVKGYMIPYTLGPILETLLHKYGDISCESKFSKECKSIIYFFLCQVLKGLHNTTVRDLNINILQEWYCHLKFVVRIGFEIDFVLSHFDRLICAFLGVESHRLKDEIPTILDKKMTELKRGLKICQEYHSGSLKSKFMIECLNEASKLKLKKASEGLF